MTSTWFRQLILSSASLAALLACLQAQGQAQGNQTDQRWYQIEVTLFAYDNAMRVQEHWPMEILEQALARNTRPLDLLSDVLNLSAWTATTSQFSEAGGLTTATEDILELAMPLHTSDFRLPDPERDAFLALPASAHGFTDTNRALTNAASYRTLYHNAWRQPVTGANQAVPVWVSGGGQFGNRHELEGTLTVRFNPGQDRVVLDARLWLTQFSAIVPTTAADSEVKLPDLPSSVSSRLTQTTDNTSWHPIQVIPVINSREMRSNEFHYVDHPAVGIVIHVSPYTVPPLPADPAALL